LEERKREERVVLRVECLPVLRDAGFRVDLRPLESSIVYAERVAVECR
jgi:hypothetical protein